MAERTTRFDSMVEKEEKKKQDKRGNPFERSTKNLKRASDNKMADVRNDVGQQGGIEPLDTDVKDTADAIENIEKEPGDARDKAKDSVSRRLNISDIIDDTKRVKKKGGRSRTFYMQDSMYDKLASVAEKQGVKPSQLLHIILDNVLEKM